MNNKIIHKTDEESFFLKMHQTSNLTNTIFSKYPCYGKDEIVVLQVLDTFEGWYIVEVVEKKNFKMG